MKPPKVVTRTLPFKRVPVPQKPKTPPAFPTALKNEQAIAALTARLLDLEARLAVLESVIALSGPDVVITSAGSVLVSAASTVEVTGTTVQISAAMVEASTAIAKVTGVVQSDTLICNSVIAASYTPGAGNLY